MAPSAQCMPASHAAIDDGREITVESILGAKDHYQVFGMTRTASFSGSGIDNGRDARAQLAAKLAV
eukprot:4846431-Prymnesium_polylepis.1